MGPVKRFVLLVLSQSRQDRATQIVIAANAAEPSMRYKIDEKWHDWAAAPAHVLRDAVLELQRMAGIEEKPYPKEGIITEQPSGKQTYRWKIRLNGTQEECVLTAMP